MTWRYRTSGLTEATREAGAATEASCAAISHAYDDYGWDLVETHMDDRNTGARALVERLESRVMSREMFPASQGAEHLLSSAQTA